ncbi:hypothetical protein LMG9449_1425 [Lactococcus lactis subsp. lactis]|uniref:Uncharacterized protein n=1 Tax=Lactococcus lactis subsp. lactis TaxID=1360 RepID=A0A0V8DXY3_LACLL|nr:hypothetical protein [Lactococcus lactis]KSU18430.1 hypothetical protein LMG9449_1425 [Lactococcus lactis subsp. lactis]MCB6852193.1 hypothetical protein [Lactococcus lactis]MCZ8492191.1 hypothetical protein [Lactococcus lactis]
MFYFLTSFVPIYFPINSSDKMSVNDEKTLALMLLLLIISAVIGTLFSKFNGYDIEDSLLLGGGIGLLVMGFIELLIWIIITLL